SASEIYTLSLHDALPIFAGYAAEELVFGETTNGSVNDLAVATGLVKKMIKSYGMEEFLVAIGNPHVSTLEQGYAHNVQDNFNERSEEHTSELQSRENLVC